MGIQDAIGKKFKLASSDKFDDYMKAVGVSFMTRQVGNNVSPVVEILEADGQYTLKSSSTFKNSSVTFRLNETFEQETPDGRKVKTTITQEGDSTLIEKQENGKTSTIIREFSADQIKMTLKVDDVVCTRIYKLQS